MSALPPILLAAALAQCPGGVCSAPARPSAYPGYHRVAPRTGFAPRPAVDPVYPPPVYSTPAPPYAGASSCVGGQCLQPAGVHTANLAGVAPYQPHHKGFFARFFHRRGR